MTHPLVALALAFVFAGAGCKEQPKSTPETTKRSEACTTALATFNRFVDTGEPDATPAQRQAVMATVLSRCIADRWSAEALACMRKAGTSHEVFQCWNQHLSKEQRDAASQALGTLSR